MTTKHTPGPWSAAETRHNYDTVIRGPKGEPIALVLIGGYTKIEGRANSAVIAAAPDLLEALQAIELAMRFPMVTADAVLDENSPIREGIRAAIARATGEQP